MADNKKIAQDVLEAVGGATNVTTATNCMTRLRLTLKNNDAADLESIKKIKGVLGAQFAGSQLQVIIGQNVPKVLDEFVAMSGVTRGAAVEENLDAPKEKLTPAVIGNRILDYLSGSMTQLIPLIMAGGLFRTFAVILGPQMLNLISETDPTYTFFYTTLYEATFYFLPIYLGYAAAKKLGASPVLGMLTGGLLIAPSLVTSASEGGIVSVYGIQIAAANYSQTVLPVVLSVPVLYFAEKFFKKVMPDVLSTVFTPFCTMIVVVPVSLIVLAPIGNELGNLVANALFGLADLGGIGVLVVMAILGGFWQLFVVAGMHMPIGLLAQVQIIAAGYDPFVFVSTNCAMTAVWGCAFGAFLRMRNKEEKGLALGYVISAIAGGVTEPALFGLIMRYRKTMIGMIVGGAIGAVVSGILGVTYYLAGGASNFMVILNYFQGGQTNIILAAIGMAVSFIIAAVIVYLTGFSEKELDEMDAE
ncbi:MAG TPA: PTS transporter subunit EIIC [Candidatus Olsenella pullicola]|uniref:PTS transporter subunit EIIC n=1 Tax=Candidatus Olsenella pullistercoris TaxID=2838712 RepID=A0A9D2EY50_9ACTN|nr:PTS transporter subunit EIIC [Candidatus Olsenella pullistercoris]HJA29873.1 PTS transporter subunit EIIC [Candidatus Olsenella pullicola]